MKEGEGLFIWDLKLEDVRETIKGRTDFRELHHDDYIAISYFLGIGKNSNFNSISNFFIFLLF